MVGALNPISIAFAVLFVGIGVDFGIQFSVRYRAERYEVERSAGSRSSMTAEHVGAPLTLAAAATAAGFLSFLPTDYKGVSELGQIAGVGMIIAYLASITRAAGAADAAQSARREGAARLSRRWRRSTISWSAIASRSSSAPPSSCWRACRCSTSCNSTSTRSICAARRSNRSRPISICASDPEHRRQRRSTCWRPRSRPRGTVAEQARQAAGSLARA